MNAQSNNIERMLVKADIPYRVYGGMRFYDRKEIKDITSYLAFINNPYDMLRFRRIINEPKRGIGEATVTMIDDISRDLRISPYEVMRTCEDFAPLSKKSSVLRNAANLFGRLMEMSDRLPLDEFFDLTLDLTGYLEYLNTFDNAETKIENVQELRTAIVQYMNGSEDPTLGGFLEEIALYTEADSDDGSDDVVTLMTVHSAKGLEFENVFIIGLEDGIFPGTRSFDNEADMEEERRLAYVAITRAKKNLCVTSARKRMIFGQTQRNVTSRFIREIGRELIDKIDSAAEKCIEVDHDNEVTEVQSLSLQQQLARDKRQANTSKSESAVYEVGERVMHSVFGGGTIISVKHIANDAMLEIAFEKVGTKKIMANYAKLKKID